MEIIWIILAVIAAIILVAYWKRRNAVWGGLIIGIIIGLVIALLSGFHWYIVGKSAVLGTIIGFGAELLGSISDKIRNTKVK